MNTKLISALLASVFAFAAAPVFASGYGSAPFYTASAGAPSSQRGQSEQTLTAERSDTSYAQSAFGGVATFSSQSGSRTPVLPRNNLFAHH
ncbi:MAG: hypothetical protein WCA85_28215 [Paraburkholderia sp.]|uniref:hypothetical protein n=1 Tax=Paraburkholderia sp. TaxID=1926495 RepID=UPI003C64AB89